MGGMTLPFMFGFGLVGVIDNGDNGLLLPRYK